MGRILIAEGDDCKSWKTHPEDKDRGMEEGSLMKAAKTTMEDKKLIHELKIFHFMMLCWKHLQTKSTSAENQMYVK